MLTRHSLQHSFNITHAPVDVLDRVVGVIQAHSCSRARHKLTKPLRAAMGGGVDSKVGFSQDYRTYQSEIDLILCAIAKDASGDGVGLFV